MLLKNAGESMRTVIVLLFLAILAAPVAAKTIYVPDDYEKIQWAVDNASVGDTIIVRDGTYKENIVVNKPLKIISENGPQRTTIDGIGIYRGYRAIEIKSNDVEIIGFRIVNSSTGIVIYLSNVTVVNNIISNNGLGIQAYSSNNTISNNIFTNDSIILEGGELEHWNTHTIENNTVNGKPIYYFKDKTGGKVPEDAGQVILANCTNMIVENLRMSNTDVGILVGFSSRITISNNTISNNNYGISLEKSTNNIISNNTISKNSFCIELWYSSNNTISNNTISNSWDGIYLSWSNSNLISKNNISNNRWTGIYLWYSYDNKIYLNDLNNNTRNAYSGRSTNIWNSTEKITYTYEGKTYTNYLGNYWSGYSATDSNGDGILDEPYVIDSNNTDYYPLTGPFQNHTIIPLKPDLTITGISVTPEKIYVGEEVTVNITVANIGNADAGSFNVSAYVNGSFHSLQTVNGLRVGERITLEFRGTATEAKDYEVKFRVDSDNTVDEREETNNEKSVIVSVFTAPQSIVDRYDADGNG